MKHLIQFTLTAVASLTLLSSCDKDNKEINPDINKGTDIYYANNVETPKPGSSVPKIKNDKREAILPEDEAYVNAGNRLGFSLFNEIEKKEPKNNNTLFSPLSLEYAMGMYMLGIEDKAYDNLVSKFQFPHGNSIKLAEYYKRLSQDLITSDEYRRFFPANAFWVDLIHKNEANPAYPQNLEKYFNASMAFANLNDSHTIEAINKWIEAMTYGRIKDLLKLQMIDGKTHFILVNTIYFKAPWLNPFDASRTKTGIFYGSTGKSEVHFMRDIVCGTHAEDNQMEAITMNAGEAYDMVIVMPKNREEFSSSYFIQNDINKILDNGMTSSFDLSLPKYEFTTSALPLSESMNNIGLNRILTSSTKEKIGFNGGDNIQIVQKCFVKWDENGLEASAATAISGNEAKPRRVVVDHPFYILIRHKLTGKILFIGHVNNIPNK